MYTIGTPFEALSKIREEPLAVIFFRGPGGEDRKGVYFDPVGGAPTQLVPDESVILDYIDVPWGTRSAFIVNTNTRPLEVWDARAGGNSQRFTIPVGGSRAFNMQDFRGEEGEKKLGFSSSFDADTVNRYNQLAAQPYAKPEEPNTFEHIMKEIAPPVLYYGGLALGFAALGFGIWALTRPSKLPTEEEGAPQQQRAPQQKRKEQQPRKQVSRGRRKTR